MSRVDEMVFGVAYRFHSPRDALDMTFAELKYFASWARAISSEEKRRIDSWRH
jgi:hypothetical protein